MKQLVELTKHQEKFSEMKVEVIAVFREEKEGVAGLEKIRERTKTPFTLCLDTGAEQTKRYSPGRREFDNYVVDKNGRLVGTIQGDLRRRAQSKQLFAMLEKIQSAEPAAAAETATTP